LQLGVHLFGQPPKAGNGKANLRGTLCASVFGFMSQQIHDRFRSSASTPTTAQA